MKKLLALLLCAVMVLGMFAGCGNNAEDPSAPAEPAELDLVGFCTVSMSESIYVLEEEALIKIFDGKAKVQTVSCDQDSALQIQQIKNFITMGADLLVINPTDIRALGDAIKEAHEAGIKVYINGATTDELSEEYYDCCTVSDEYLCGAYVAMIAKNWIEAHADDLNAANPDWELAFLESNLAEETVIRSKGEQSILEPYLKNAKGEYVDASGNVVDEANKVDNPAFCQIALDHYAGVITEQDQQNGGLNVANILTTNPNTRVFIAYNSLASTQGGQYIVDNYADQIDDFAFFSAGVMGNEADYIVGSVSKTDGVTPSVMRGAVQFGVSAAGGDVATSVANTAYGILYGVEGVDYFKKNPDGIAAWWAVDEAWAPDGVASVAHFNILSGATVQAFDPIETLQSENTVFYWNSRDGFVEAEAEEEAEGSAPIAAEGDSYVFEENNGFMDITWTLTLGDDGRYTLTEVNQMFPDGASYVGNYTREGDMAICAQMEGNAPGQFDWANPAGFTVQLGKGFFAPEGRELPVVNSYVYQENNGFMDITWTLTLVNNGRYTLTEVNMMFPDGASYVGNYTLEGDMAICAQMEGNAPGQFDWANPAGFTVQLGEGVFAPEGREMPEAPEGIAAGVYSYMEPTPFGEILWTVTINEDGTAIVAQPENEGMGNPSWTATVVNNADGSFTTADCVGDGPQIAGFWKNNGITWINNGDGTVTPVE